MLWMILVFGVIQLGSVSKIISATVRATDWMQHSSACWNDASEQSATQQLTNLAAQLLLVLPSCPRLLCRCHCSDVADARLHEAAEQEAKLGRLPLLGLLGRADEFIGSRRRGSRRRPIVRKKGLTRQHSTGSSRSS